MLLVTTYIHYIGDAQGNEDGGGGGGGRRETAVNESKTETADKVAKCTTNCCGCALVVLRFECNLFPLS